MKTLRLVAEFTHDEKDLRHFTAVLTELYRALLTLGFVKTESTVTDDADTVDSTPPVEPIARPVLATETETFSETLTTGTSASTFPFPQPGLVSEVEPESEPEAKPINVAFASDEAGELAFARGLTTRNFQGLEPSSDNGFTVPDVKKAAKRAGK